MPLMIKTFALTDAQNPQKVEFLKSIAKDKYQTYTVLTI